MHKLLRRDRRKVARRLLRGVVFGALSGAISALPAWALPNPDLSTQAATATNTAEVTTSSAHSPLETGINARGGVLNETIPSIEHPLLPIWEWSRERINQLADKYRDQAVVGDDVLTLQQAEDMALANDHALKASKYSTQASHYNVKSAEAGRYPTVGFSGSMSANGTLNSSQGSTYIDTSSGGNRVKVSSGKGVRTSLGMGISVSQTLYDYSLKRKIRRAELNEVASLANYESQRLDVILALRKAWFTAYADQVNLDVLRESVANKKLRLQQAKGLYDAGTKARIDIASAESDLAQAELKVIAQETQLSVDWINLNSAMGTPSHKPYRLVLNSYWDRGIDMTESEMVSIALAHRPELLNLQAQLRAQLCAIEMADSDKYPSLRASAGINESGNMTPLDGTWNVGISLNWNLFNGFLGKYEKKSAQASARQVAEQFEQQRLNVYKDVLSKAVVMRQAAAAVDAAEAGMAKAQENYRLASARYQVGVGQSVEVSDAEVALSQAQLSYVEAASTYREAKAGLIRAMGVDDLDNLPEGRDPIELDAIPNDPQEEE